MSAARQLAMFAPEVTDPEPTADDRATMAACVDLAIRGLIKRGDLRPNQPPRILTDDEETP